ncbi:MULTISPECIES: hypothetical protein [unclassified Pseudomonas]|uniref:hypothetical protein n=1 Tax=unclassified Pseudomonas TaxID=196821 RepID=UPI000C880576|nr:MULTISPECIES: hypothetical protein [unclassified Pseudomonas]PMX26661.1 hypothetical protein C1Y23_12725 [Pseudomonas sp. GW460-12]PMX34118.1 hypothetical protein C1Y24_15010 [Pseudomonas sp. MPR-R2A4]PMX40998.1 hypothetical protein C1Y26_12510 [Pseudomonas sp. MPR-R2A7]PMX53577.1 hypothetical protein C1Y17_12725 [Pseudomonas sp. MPR-R2A6]PMX90563.1 hypothetical protein C1Y21_15645 [Pseudomonas sp. MPR-R2A3]
MRFCDFADIDFSPRLLSWEPEQIAQWQFFKGWHDEAERSPGFALVTHSAMEFPKIVEQTARDKQAIYRFFQLSATWQRLADAADHLKCLHDRPRRDGPLVLLTTDENIAYCSPAQARQRFLCLMAPDTPSARALDLPLIAIDPSNPGAQAPQIGAQLATLARNASLRNRTHQIASNRRASTATAPGLSWQQHFFRLLDQAPESLVAMTPHRQLNARQLHAHAVRLAERLSKV